MRANWMRLIAVVLLITASCAAQGPLPGGGGALGTPPPLEFSRSEFATQCGIQNTSEAAEAIFSVNDDGQWESGEPSRGITDTARLWHETNYMVDMHGAPGPRFSSMHKGMMCFDAQGHLTRVFDRYMEALHCGCQRVTTMAFAADGTVTEWAETFVDVRTGARIKTPVDTTAFPEVWQFHQLSELPFYSLLKPNEGQAAGQNEKQ